jgi:muramoyltetrapeptide carboxypeptidase
VILSDRLHPGDTVAVVAPSSPFNRQEFRKGCDVLRDMGFYVTYGTDIFSTERYLAGSDERRANEIKGFFSDRRVKAIICVRGGFGAIRILRMLNGDLFAKNPKIFIGFSDITALLLFMMERAEVVVFHGPMVTGLSKLTPDAKDHMLKMITTPQVGLSLKFDSVKILRPGNATGILSGGNLATLVHLTATPWQPDFNKKILFLEEISESPYRIDRMLSQLKMSGMIDGVSGIILGDMVEEESLLTTERMVLEITEDKAIPVISRFPAGHIENNFMLPFGVNVTLDAEKGYIIIDDRYLK